MARDVVVERESLADDAKAFRTLIAELRSAQGHDLPASAARVDVPVLAWAGAARSRRLARQLLAYARMQALAPARLEPSPFLRDLARSLRQALDARIDVEVHVDHDCPACLADHAALEEALLDLVANARDAMPEGGRLGLAARACVLPGQRPGVEISVSDSGPGMSGEGMERAGQPFFTTKTDLPLAGMGLAAANGFARGSDGTLALHSAREGGLTAALRLPQASGPG